MGDPRIIAIVFRLINFGIVIGIFAYVFKAKLLDLIKSQINEEHKHADSLEKRAHQLKAEKQQVEDGIKQDAVSCAQLKDKVDAWRAAAQAELVALDEQKKHRIGQLQERAQAQAQQIEQHRAQKTIAPQALVHAKKQLIADFASHKDTDAYMQRIIADWERS